MNISWNEASVFTIFDAVYTIRKTVPQLSLGCALSKGTNMHNLGTNKVAKGYNISSQFLETFQWS